MYIIDYIKAKKIKAAIALILTLVIIYATFGIFEQRASSAPDEVVRINAELIQISIIVLVLSALSTIAIYLDFKKFTNEGTK